MASGSQNNTTYQAQKWTNLRAFTIGNTAKNVDGTASVSWSKDEILGASTDAYFLRGDKVWSNSLSANFSAGTYILAGTYLQAKNHIYMDAGSLQMKYNNEWYEVVKNHNNGNITINAASAVLYLGYQTTTSLNFMNGKATMNNSGHLTAPKFIGALQGNADTATALTSNAGGGEQPIYFTGGKPAATSYALKATVNNGDANYVAYYSGARAISSSKAATTMIMPAHYYHNLYNNNPTTGTTVYVHYYNGDTTSTNTFANLRVKSGTSFKVLAFGGDGALSWGGTMTANGGYLKSTANGNTVTIGSQNTSFTHIYNSASIPFIFNNTVESTSGDLGTTSYPWHNIYMGPSNGAGIYYQGSKANYRMIRFIDNTSDAYGNGISIGGGGQTIIGGGESADTAAAQVGTGGSEIMYVCNDGNVDIISNLQNGWDSRKVMTFNTSGYLMLSSYINSPTSNNENPSVSQFIVTNGSDNYYRKASVAHVASAIDGQHKWVRIGGDTMTGALTVSSTGNNRATVYIRSAGDVPMDLYLGSKNTNYWSISCRESADPYLGFYWAGSSSGWALLMHTNKYVEIPVHAYVGGYNNTSYSLSTASFICNSWVRTKGSAGWYNEDYSGGWYMTDTKWIRSFNSKPVLIDIGTNNSYGIGGHRLALGLAGSSHTSIMFKGGDVMYGFAVNNNGNWYFGKRTSKSFESTSGDAYSYYGDATSILPMNNNAVTLGDSSHKWSHLYCQGRVYLDEWIQFSGTTGLYCPNTNGAHWYPNNASSYGTWVMQGSRGGYAGIQLGASTNYMTVMDDATNKGLFQEGQRWIFYYNRSTQRVGIRDSSTSGGWGIQCNGDTYITGAVYSGDNRGGKLRMVDNWLGFYSSANAAGTRYGYIQCDVNRMYFRKENSSSQTHYFDFGSAVYIAGELNSGGVRARGGMMALSEANSGNCAVWFVNSTNTESYWKAAVQSDKEAFVFYRYSGTTPQWRFAIRSNGTTSTSSSRKIKHNIQDINFNTGYIIDRMKPVSYIVNGDTTNQTTYGFIYEDLVQVLPNVCVSSDGNVGIMYTTIIPVLTKEIQNLRRRLAAVETELSYYRSKI